MGALKRIKNASLDYQYTPDATGAVKNIIGIPVPELDPASDSYNYEPDSNRLDNRTGSNPADYTLDDNGNTVSDGTRSFIYDETNRLIRVEQDAAVVAQYGYDALNRRTMKTVAGTTTLYHYDTNGLLLAETMTDGTPLRDYIYLQGQPFAVKIYQGQEAGLYYYINDHLGTPQQLVDSSGQIVWQAAYLPFGKAVVVGSVTNNFRFAGQYFDAETGLHYNYHRYYDPKIGRYLKADPIGFEGGINLYAYVQNNPVNFMDPEGLMIGSLISKIGAKLIGQTSKEAFIAGKITDAGIGAILAFDNGTIVPSSSNQFVNNTLLGLQGYGALQTASIATIVGGAAVAGSAPYWLPVGLSALAGIQIGSFIDDVYTRISGQSLGEDIYDWRYPSKNKEPDCK